MLNKQYDAEYKLEAVKRVEKACLPIARVAKELRVKESTLYGWVQRYKKKTIDPFPGSGKVSSDDEITRA